MRPHLFLSPYLSRPTFRNLTDSFEGWAYRNGLLRQLHRLERQQWLEGKTSPTGDRLHRLTEAGRLQALGGRDPVGCWRRRWDGLWRLVLFDVPEVRSSTRNKFRHYLKSHGFGYLQNSVWITPDPVHEQRTILGDGPVDVESLILLEARPCAGESDAEIVAGAWDFTEINAGYARHREILIRCPRREIDTEAAAKAFHRWLRKERAAWLEVMELDPLLPEVLLPPEYAGRQAWGFPSGDHGGGGREDAGIQAELRADNKLCGRIIYCRSPLKGTRRISNAVTHLRSTQLWRAGVLSKDLPACAVQTAPLNCSWRSRRRSKDLELSCSRHPRADMLGIGCG